jgi:hypothetical protein
MKERWYLLLLVLSMICGFLAGASGSSVALAIALTITILMTWGWFVRYWERRE